MTNTSSLGSVDSNAIVYDIVTFETHTHLRGNTCRLRVLFTFLIFHMRNDFSEKVQDYRHIDKNRTQRVKRFYFTMFSFF